MDRFVCSKLGISWEDYVWVTAQCYGSIEYVYIKTSVAGDVNGLRAPCWGSNQAQNYQETHKLEMLKKGNSNQNNNNNKQNRSSTIPTGRSNQTTNSTRLGGGKEGQSRSKRRGGPSKSQGAPKKGNQVELQQHIDKQRESARLKREKEQRDRVK